MPSHPLWRGSDARLYDAAQRLHAEIPWMQRFYPEADSESYYFWLVNFGLRERGEMIGPWLPPLPGSELQSAVQGNYSPEVFLNAGSEAAAKLLKLLESAAIEPYAPRRILDFGCGCARVLRHLLPLGGRSELWGCDIDDRAIAFCRESIGAARFFTNRAEPPLPAPDGGFDLVFSISVFTHLGSGLRDAWLRELRRILPSGGLAAISVHGEVAWTKLLADPDFQRSMLVRVEDIEVAAKDWDSTGVAFLPHLVPKAYDHEEPYGLVFIRPDVLPTLCLGFEMLRYEPGALSEWQDLALLRASG